MRPSSMAPLCFKALKHCTWQMSSIESKFKFNHDVIGKFNWRWCTALNNYNVLCSLKPENILIDADGYTKLCDFGLSLLPPKISSSNSIADDASSNSSVSSSSVTTMKEGSKIATTTFFGTLEYMPPEFFTKRVYSGQSDLWAFGCLLYELLVGLPPFMDAKGNSRNTCHRIMSKALLQPSL